MNYEKKRNLVCFSIDEMKNLLSQEMKKVISGELRKQQLDLDHFRSDTDAMGEFVADLVVKNNKRKEFVELFYSTTLADSIYKSEETSVCFDVKRGVREEALKTVKDYESLLGVLEEDTETDFAIVKKDRLRKFQLKQYKEELKTDDLANFIKKKLEGYGDLGQVNLLVVLQGKNNDGSEIVSTEIDFHKVAEIVKEGNFKIDAEVLIAWNDRNISNSIIQVYPELNEYKIPLVFPSESW